MRTLGIVTLLALGWWASPCWAWWDEGHRTVALVAERSLSEGARSYVGDVLAHHPDSSVRDLAEASVWPDRIRSDPRYHRGSWHFTNIPVFLDVAERPLPVTGESLQALNRCTAILKDAAAEPDEKAVALSWVAHLIGDIHQPLHAVSGYSRRFPEGDRGGGLLEVRLGETETNLHAFWDSGGGLFWKGTETRPAALAERLLTDGREAGAHGQRSPVRWQEESYTLAREIAYRGVTVHAALSEQYIAGAQDVSRDRMAQAGYRLAAYLERLQQASYSSTGSP